MKNLFFEEFLGRCENASIVVGGECLRRGIIRRSMGIEYGTIGIAYCEKCMPEFFFNPKNYPIFISFKTKIEDPLYKNYVEFYNSKFTIEAKQRMS